MAKQMDAKHWVLESGGCVFTYESSYISTNAMLFFRDRQILEFRIGKLGRYIVFTIFGFTVVNLNY